MIVFDLFVGLLVAYAVLGMALLPWEALGCHVRLLAAINFLLHRGG